MARFSRSVASTIRALVRAEPVLFSTHVGVRDGDAQRYVEHGQPLVDGKCITVAPCVADRWQGRGHASEQTPPAGDPTPEGPDHVAGDPGKLEPGKLNPRKLDPDIAPISTAILQTVKRPSIGVSRMTGPANSIAQPSAPAPGPAARSPYSSGGTWRSNAGWWVERLDTAPWARARGWRCPAR